MLDGELSLIPLEILSPGPEDVGYELSPESCNPAGLDGVLDAEGLSPAPDDILAILYWIILYTLSPLSPDEIYDWIPETEGAPWEMDAAAGAFDEKV